MVTLERLDRVLQLDVSVSAEGDSRAVLQALI